MKALKVIIAIAPALLLTGCLEINLSVGSGGSSGKVFEPAWSRTKTCKVNYHDVCMKPPGSNCQCPSWSIQ